MDSSHDRLEFDFDLVDQKTLKARLLKRRWSAIWSCVGVLALVLFVLVIVVLARPDKHCPKAVAGECLYALGGGVVNNSSLDFPQLKRPECGRTFEAYFGVGGQYWADLDRALGDARHHFNDEKAFPQVNLSLVVVFDIDETALSNLEEMKKQDWYKTFDAASFSAWEQSAKAPAIDQTLKLYKQLRGKGFGVTFITGRGEAVRNATVQNLANAGYGSQCSKDEVQVGELCYLELGLRAEADAVKTATRYKSEKRLAFVEEHPGTKLVGSVGDQFSDLLGESGAAALFKLPNPVYYIV